MMVVLGASTLTVMAGATVSPIINKMREALDVSAVAAGFIITVHALFVAIFSPVVGQVVDRIGTRRPLIFGLLLYAAAGGSGLVIASYWPLLLSRAFLGVGAAAIFVSITVIITDLYAGSERNRWMGRRISANSFGGVVWPLLGGFLGAISWHLPFGIYLVGFPLALIAFLVLPETHADAMAQRRSVESLWRIFKTRPTLFMIFGLVLLTTIALYTIVVFLPQLLEKRGVTHTVTIALFISTMTLASGTTAFLYERIKADLPYLTIVRGALLMWALAFTTIATTSSEMIIVAAVAMTGMAQGVMLPAVLVWVSDISPPQFSGRVISFTGMFAFLGQFLSPALFGPLTYIVGLEGVFLVVAGISGGVWLLVSWY